MSEGTLTFRTSERAAMDRLAIDASCVLLGEFRPDDAPTMQVGFVSLASAAEFVRELALDDVRVLAAPHEDANVLLAAILGATLH